jgi:ferredoxin
VKVRVNSDLCQGHSRCCSLAPELFEVDDYGLSIALNDGVVPAGMEQKARLCVDSCPEFAIEIVEEK